MNRYYQKLKNETKRSHSRWAKIQGYSWMDDNGVLVDKVYGSNFLEEKEAASAKVGDRLLYWDGQNPIVLTRVKRKVQ